MDQASYRAWLGRITLEQQAIDKANNMSQERTLLDYSIAMGWLRQRTLEAEERIAQAEAGDVAGLQNANSQRLQPLGRAATNGQGVG